MIGETRNVVTAPVTIPPIARPSPVSWPWLR